MDTIRVTVDRSWFVARTLVGPWICAPSKAAVEEIPDSVPGWVVWEERGMRQMVIVQGVKL